MQPKSIQRFDMFYLGSIGAGVAGFFVGYESTVQQLRAATAASGIEIGGGVIAAVFIVSISISLLLWYLVSSRGNVIAKWIVVVFFVLSLLGIPAYFRQAFTLTVGLQALGLALQAVAVYFLFQADAKAWFDKDEPR